MARQTKGLRAKRTVLAPIWALLVALASCDEKSSTLDASAAPPASQGASAQPIAQPEGKPGTTRTAVNQAPAKRESPSEALAATRSYEEKEPTSWRLGELSDVAPAGPATATPNGVVMVTLNGDLALGRWHPNGSVSAIGKSKSDFAAYGRGPALAGSYAYWIRKTMLLRRRLDGSTAPEVLARDAREGTRVAAALIGSKRKAVAAYIAESGEQLVARLWGEAGERLLLTPEGSQATSVNLVPSNGDLLAIVLEGRTSMSPIHARRLLLRGKVPHVREDVVVWVGPPSQPLSEVVSLAGPQGDAWAFLTLERSITEFGLAWFRVAGDPEMDVEVSWLTYPNGINPAPVAAGTACGRSLVLFARPSESRPRSPQELHIARLSGARLEPSEVVARSRAFNNISLAGVKGGALLTWTADWRTWARTIFCK